MRKRLNKYFKNHSIKFFLNLLLNGHSEFDEM